jgi:hypothetical protein
VFFARVCGTAAVDATMVLLLVVMVVVIFVFVRMVLMMMVMLSVLIFVSNLIALLTLSLFHQHKDPLAFSALRHLS